MLRVELFGQFNIYLDDRPVEIASRPAQSLLAYLLIHPGIQHRREKLAGLFWPDAPEENARRSLRQALWQIRKGFKQAESLYLRADDIAIAVNLATNDRVDALTFDRPLSQDLPVDEIITVVSVYRGELLPGFYDDWVVLERERLQVSFEHKMNQLLECLVAERRWKDVLIWGEHWIALGAAPEAAYRALMVAHHRLGNPSAVALTFQRCTNALERELGLPPAEQTRQLYDDLLIERPSTILPGQPTRTTTADVKPAGAQEGQVAGEPPFKGLLSFEEEDSAIFYGREQLTDQLLQKLNNLPEEAKLLAIIGASGSGKSSLVRAGLIPAVKQQSLPAGQSETGSSGARSETWEIHLVVPTTHPLESLAASLTQTVESVSATATLVDDMAQDPRSLNLYLAKRQAALHKPGGQAHVLLVIDQFEEIFTQCREEIERQAFIDNLLSAASERATVVLTLRADFYVRCAAYPILRQLLAANQEFIGSMSTPELRSAIEKPANAAGWEFESGLVDLILRDIGADPASSAKSVYQVEPGALPLLCHALLET